MKRAVAGAAVVASLLLGCRSGPSSTPAAGAADVTVSRVQFVEPWFDLPKGQSHRLGIFLDGRRVGGCVHGELEDGTPCAEEIIPPGSHVVRVLIDYRDPQTLQTLHHDYFVAETRILLGVGQDVRLDLSGMDAEDPEAFLHRKEGKRSRDACVRKLDALAAAPTCTGPELAAAASLLQEATRTCRGLDDDDERAALARLGHVRRNLFEISPERCLLHDELARLGGKITGQGRGGWGSYREEEAGSWRWARDVLPERSQWERLHETRPPTVHEHLTTMRKSLPVAVERTRMLDDVLVGVIAKKRPAQAIARAMEAPFSLDPGTTHGHRLLLLFAGGDEWNDRQLSGWVAGHLQKATRHHCGEDPAAVAAVRYLMQDDHLSRPEWSAIQALVSRTPADQAIDNACTRAVRNDLDAEVADARRLEWLAAFDCSKRRHPRRRADAIRYYLTDSSSPVDPRTRDRLRAELVACIGSDSMD